MIANSVKTVNLLDLEDFSPNDIGQKIHRLASDLYPILQSITGNGFRETLNIINRYIPLEIHEIPSDTKVFDWTVPKEWNIKDAYIKNSKGQKIVDFKKSNLHVVNYSIPVNKKVSLKELKLHLFTLPDYPKRIPERTFYHEDWGFCLSHKQYLELRDEEYEVCIDSSLETGHLTYGEYLLKGETSDEVLISCHTCHPSLCNDNFSGIAIAVFLAKHLSQLSRRYSYRFLFVSGTIGSITWLSLNEAQASRIKHSLVLTCVGGPGKLTYKKSRRGDAEIDKIVAYVLKRLAKEYKISAKDYEITDFFPSGYDERQFCSPGFDLAVGCFTRAPHDRVPEYHTSADNLSFVQPQYLADSFSKCLAIFQILETNKIYLNQIQKYEPQLAVGGQVEGLNELAILWVLNLSDGFHTLLDISQRSGLAFDVVSNAANALLKRELLKAC